jgi:hypothetical protein
MGSEIVMAKRKVPERAKDCKTLAEKIAFSQMVRSKWEALNGNPWSCPSDIDAIVDTYDDPDCPWSHPEWASHCIRAEEEKQRSERAMERETKRETNRILYGVSKKAR